MAGQILKHCTKTLHIPYTPVLTILGVIIGVMDKTYWADSEVEGEEDLKHEHVYRQISESWHEPTPEIVFLVFLPALIFESAFNADWYTFKR